MGVAIECPVCESVFQAPSVTGQALVKCPACAHEFAVSQEGEGSSAARARWRSEAQPLAAGVTPAKRRPPKLVTPDPHTGLPEKISKPPQPVPVPAAEPIPTAEPEGPESIKPPGIASIRKRRRQQQRRAMLITVVGSVVFIGLISGLTAVLIQRLNQTPVANVPGSDEAQALADTVPGMGDPDPGNAVAKAAADAPPAVPQPILLRDLPPREVEFLTENQLDETWAIAQPRLIQLEVEGPLGNQSAVGLIVDSRGWVLTSLSAVTGASRIRASAAHRLIDEVGQSDPLTDEIRGVIAIDRQRDLVLLSINRRFVVTLGGLQVMPLVELVTGHSLIQSAPPRAEEPYGAVEVEVRQRCQMDELGPAAKRKASTLGIDESCPWFLIDCPTTVLPGTPLFDENGRLAAIHSMVADGRPHALPLDTLESLLENAQDDAQRLATLTSGSDTGNAPATAVMPAHPMRDVSVELNQRGAACQAFGWLPQTPDEYQQLQAFADCMTQLLIYIAQHEDDAAVLETVEQLQAQVGRWRDALAETMGQPALDRVPRLEAINELAVAQLERAQSSDRERFVVFSGRVMLAGIMSPDPEGMFLAVGHDRAYLRVPFEAEGQVMLPDSKWLFFIQRPETRKVARYQSQSKPKEFSADQVQLLFAIGPLQ